MYNYEDEAWTDLLTSYDGESIEYDEIGNPTSYLGYSMSWNGIETGFYYLQSRYYIGRFISSDAYFSTGQGVNSCNMFLYCGNNPFNRIDSTGTSWKSVKNFFNRVKKAVTNFVKKTFGANSSVSTTKSTAKTEQKLVYIDTGYSHKEFSNTNKKPIMFNCNYETTHIIKNTLGVSVNSSKASMSYSSNPVRQKLTLSLPTENNNSVSYSIGLSPESLSFEMSQSFSEDNITMSWYSSININTGSININTGMIIGILVAILTEGAYSPFASGSPTTPTPFPSPIPAP